MAEGATPKAAVTEEGRFWGLLEDAWRAAPEEAKLRPPAKGAEDALDVVDAALEARVIPALERILRDLPAAELAAFDRILEKRLWDLDRADVQARTDGSDDGFLYGRGWIVAMGRAYWEAGMAVPSRLVRDRECERLCYLPRDLHEELHGPLEPSGISRETGSNRVGWGQK
jgi:hypothetical protein